MVDLPVDAKGLSWIVSKDPTRLQLIPGLQPISIAAAAAGDQQALAYLRFAAQHHAAFPDGSARNDLDRVLVKVATAAQDDDDITVDLDRVVVEVLIAAHDGDDCAVRTARIIEGAPFADLIQARQDHTMSLLTQAVREGELAAVMWMRAICMLTEGTHRRGLAAEAAKAGQLGILKYLRSQSRPEYWDEDTATAALPHLDCLKWMLTTDAPGGCCPYPDGILSDLARHHGLPAVQWLCDQHELLVCYESILDTAVELADRPMVEWLRARDHPPDWQASLCMAAARRGDISMLGWLRSQDPPCPWDESVTEAAARWFPETLQWLRAQEPPCPWGPSTCAAAAESGKLEVLMWLRDHHPPCPWNWTCARAACSQPDVKIPQWILQQQGRWEPGTQSRCASKAAEEGHLAVLAWLSSIGIPLTGDLYVAAARAGHIHILRFLQTRKVALPEHPPIKFHACSSNLPLRMCMADIGILHESYLHDVRQARRACRMFHGLVRWCRRAVSDPSRKAHLAFDSLAKDRSGQMLLLQLSQLPPDLVTKIAVAAELQYDCNSPPA